FRATIEPYPRGNKVPDALLKVGYCYQALGKTDKAHAILEQVVNLYPKTEPAALAAKRLETPGTSRCSRSRSSYRHSCTRSPSPIRIRRETHRGTSIPERPTRPHRRPNRRHRRRPH